MPDPSAAEAPGRAMLQAAVFVTKPFKPKTLEQEETTVACPMCREGAVHLQGQHILPAVIPHFEDAGLHPLHGGVIRPRWGLSRHSEGHQDRHLGSRLHGRGRLRDDGLDCQAGVDGQIQVCSRQHHLHTPHAQTAGQGWAGNVAVCTTVGQGFEFSCRLCAQVAGRCSTRRQP